MRKKLLSSLLLGMLALPSMVTAAPPADIQKGNILHCFNWKLSDVKAELSNIAAAGFGAVQVSPLQRNVSPSEDWSTAYRPYDFKFIASSALGSADDLKSLCSEAEKYGIKIVVDVVENHVDGHGAGDHSKYHDPWWNSNGRLRWNGSVDYSNRYSITHNQMGGGDGYPDVNSEDTEIAARGKAYIEELKSMGVKGIRFDAAKHVALPSEGCQFWATVTSVPGMYYYGEVLDSPGGNGDALMKEYTTYMSVTDNNYGDNASKNGGVPTSHMGWGGDGKIAADKFVYWGESHDTYANNDGFSKNIDQSIIDRAYAAVACRNGATALYLSRPSARNFSDIKLGVKGSTAFKSAHITAVNNFRNAMVGKKDYFTGNGNACSITRENGGAVIVMKGSGNISIANGGSYCPAGTYTDKVSGGTFTVTASTISGNVGPSGIAVLYNGGDNPNPNPNPDPDPTPDPTGSLWVLGNIQGAAGWGTTPGTGVAMTQDGTKYTAKGVTFAAATGETSCYFNLTDYVGATWNDLNSGANRYGAATEGAPITLGTAMTITKYTNNVNASACMSWTIAPGTYDIVADLSSMKLTVTNSGDTPNPNPNPDPDPTPDPDPVPGTLTIRGDYNLAYSGTKENVHYWGGSAPSSWPGVKMETAIGSDGKTYKVAKIDGTSTGLLFNTNGNQDKTGDLVYASGYVMDDNGKTGTAVVFKGGDNPNPNPNPNPDPVPGGDHYVYYDGTFSNPRYGHGMTPATAPPPPNGPATT